MKIFEYMNRKTAYTAQELADLMGETLKDVEADLDVQSKKGTIDSQEARGYIFYFKNET